MKIILASTSPRRKELMDLLDIEYQIIPSQFDEEFIQGLTTEEQSQRIAFMKAKLVFDKLSGDRVVIGSDTFVIKDDKVYGKPNDKKEATQMLQELKNGTNKIITSLAILVQQDKKYMEYIDYDTVMVYIHDMTDSEIEAWLNSGDAMDKAGAYAVQGKFSVFIDKIEGNYSAAMGLPVEKLYQYIKKYIKD